MMFRTRGVEIKELGVSEEKKRGIKGKGIGTGSGVNQITAAKNFLVN